MYAACVLGEIILDIGHLLHEKPLLLSQGIGEDTVSQIPPGGVEQGSGGPVWDEMLCKLSEYLLHRYYYQAVSDYDLVCRVKMAVVSCIAAALLSGADPEERISLIQLYSKEIENNIQNTEALLDGAYTAPALTDRNLLGLLLG